jgi:hypothetical protein
MIRTLASLSLVSLAATSCYEPPDTAVGTAAMTGGYYGGGDPCASYDCDPPDAGTYVGEDPPIPDPPDAGEYEPEECPEVEGDRPEISGCWEPINLAIDGEGNRLCPELNGDGEFCTGEADALADAIEELSACTKEANLCNHGKCCGCTERALNQCCAESARVRMAACNLGQCTAHNCYFPTDYTEEGCGQGQAEPACLTTGPRPSDCHTEIDCTDPSNPCSPEELFDSLDDNPYCQMCGRPGQPTCDDLDAMLPEPGGYYDYECFGTIHTDCI